MSGETDLSTDIELYDSDVLAIEKVIRVLNESRHRATTIEAWRNEITTRFAEINLKAEVVLRAIEGVEDETGHMHVPADTRLLTTISITGRIEEEAEFDHDRMAHEVRSNIRGLDQPEVATPVSVPVNGLGKRTKSGLYLPGN